MSKITGKEFGESFALRVVSGMVVDGSLIVSWATGDHASSQIDWGYDSTVPYQTEKPLLQPGDRGYTPNQAKPILMRYHRVAFPKTYVDTEHFFRALSVNRRGERVISRVYSVYVTDRLFNTSKYDSIGVEVEIKPVTVSEHSQDQPVAISSLPLADEEPKGRVDTISLNPEPNAMTAPDASSVDGRSSMETSITLTLDN